MAEDKVTFAAIVIVAIVAIVGILGLTGFGGFPLIAGFSTTATGTATVNVTAEISIVLTDANISFGNGTVNEHSPFAILDSTGATAVNGTWAATNDPFTLENDGNVNANVSIKASSNASAWLGGTGNQTTKFNYTNSEAKSCLLDSAAGGNATWITLTTSDTVMCQKLNYTDASDMLRIDLQIQIPNDSPPGLKTNTITFTAAQSA